MGWGRAAARCFKLHIDVLHAEQQLTLMPVPDSFICPISTGVMQKPVATVDGSIYDRDQIEAWIRHCKQNRLSVTSPVTGLDLPNLTLLPLPALKRAIETYLHHRSEFKEEHLARRSFCEAALCLEQDLELKQATQISLKEEIDRLRLALEESEVTRKTLVADLFRAQEEVRALKASGAHRHDVAPTTNLAQSEEVRAGGAESEDSVQPHLDVSQKRGCRPPNVWAIVLSFAVVLSSYAAQDSPNSEGVVVQTPVANPARLHRANQIEKIGSMKASGSKASTQQGLSASNTGTVSLSVGKGSKASIKQVAQQTDQKSNTPRTEDLKSLVEAFDGTSPVAGSAVQRLIAILGDSKLQSELVSLGVIPGLVRVLKSSISKQDDIRSAAVIMALVMLHNGGFTQFIIEADVFAALLNLFRAKTANLRSTAAALLAAVVNHGPTSKKRTKVAFQVIDAGGIEAVTHLLKDTDADVVRAAVRLVASLANARLASSRGSKDRLKAKRKLVSFAGNLEPLVGLLKAGKFPVFA